MEIIENHKPNSLVTNVDSTLDPNTVSRTVKIVPTSTQATSLASCVITSSHPETLLKVIIPGEKLGPATNAETSSKTRTFCGPTRTVRSRTTVGSNSSVMSVQKNPELIAQVVNKSSSCIPITRIITTVPMNREASQCDVEISPMSENNFHMSHNRNESVKSVGNVSNINSSTRTISNASKTELKWKDENDLFNQSNINQIDGGDSVVASSDEGEDSEEELSEEVNEGTNEEHVSVLEETIHKEDVSYEDTNDDESEEDSDNEDDHMLQAIPVFVSNRINERKIKQNRNPVRKTIQTNPRIEASLSLPTIAVTNFRSLSPKITNVKIDILEREIDIMLGSETWQKDSNRRLKAEIETMLEMDGLEFLSCPRPSSKRGGGCAVIVNRRKFTVEKLQVAVPNKLEIVWCLIRPKNIATPNEFREIISCAFYSPPNY